VSYEVKESWSYFYKQELPFNMLTLSQFSSTHIGTWTQSTSVV